MNSWTGFLTLIEREAFRFSRLAVQTIVPPILTTVLFVVIFGYSLGSRIEQVSGFPYILFILPGLVGMNVIINAFANTSTSLFMARIDHSIENILIAPLSPLRIVVAFVIGGIARGVVVGGLTLLVACLITHLAIDHWALMIVSLVGLSATFSAIGIISALWAEHWDHLAVFNHFVITPFIYLGGVFYSIHMLPPFWQKISQFNPIFYLIDTFRYALLGVSDAGPALSFGVLGVMTLLSVAVAVGLFKRGYKIVV